LGAPVRGILLMAAAVGYQECEDGDENPFHRRDPQRPQDWVIHSACDRVLGSAFPLGDKVYTGHHGEAVGLHGWPISPTPRWHRSLETDLGHFDYWKGSPLVLSTVPAMLAMQRSQELPERPKNVRCRKLQAIRPSTRTSRTRNVGDPSESDWKILVPPR
jgi:hypothetical protein